MPILSSLHHLFNADTCNTYLPTLRWKEHPLPVPGAQATLWGPGARITTGQAGNATGGTAADVPFMISPTRSWPRVSGQWGTGSLPPSSCAWRVRRVVLPGRWGSLSAPVIGGAGGYGMR